VARGTPISRGRIDRTLDRTRMPRPKPPSPDALPSPPRHAGSAEIAAMVARTAPAVLDLLEDGVPRSRAAIITALTDRHSKDEVVRTLMRLAVTGRVEEAGGRYTLTTEPDPEVG
jgi:hypothetical protein